jgi:cysteine desulfurase / selenocysteine lyase
MYSSWTPIYWPSQATRCWDRPALACCGPASDPTGHATVPGRRRHDQERAPAHSEWNDIPHKFEAGTPNVAQAIGLGAAVDYLNALGMGQVQAHEQAMAAYAMSRLETVPNLHIYGPPAQERGSVVTFNLLRGSELLIHPHDLASILDLEGIAIRAGHHCAQPLMEYYGVPASARASFYLYNTESEVDRLVAGLLKAQHLFGLI